MKHILDLYNASKDGQDLVNLNEYLRWNGNIPEFNLDQFKQQLDIKKNIREYGQDHVGFIYTHSQLIGFDHEGRSVKHLCDNSDSEILEIMGLDDQSSSEKWEEYAEETTTARCGILDTISEYAVLVEKNENERIFVMLNSWYDPIFSKSYPLDHDVYGIAWD